MNVIVTCGPSSEPIDAVRRITNFSTGRLGTVLSEAFADAGHRVLCLRGTGSSASPPDRAGIRLVGFSTNEELVRELDQARAASEPVHAVLHAAALADFRVDQVLGPKGEAIDAAKIDSRLESLTIRLTSAVKILPGLRERFPGAWIVGWKYELNGDHAGALAKGFEQIRTARTDGCVVNGAAFGPGFGLCTLPDAVEPAATAEALAGLLLGRLGGARDA